MTWVYLHLITNHFPVILTVLGTAALLVSFWWRGQARAVLLYALATLVLAGATVIPAWITGNQSHAVVEERLGVKEGMVESHELFAEGTLWITLAMAGLAGFTLWRVSREEKMGPAPAALRHGVLAAALLGSVMIGYTALLGARITHDVKPPPVQPSDGIGTK
ncbi:MAG: hypothetical protein HY560_04355 [Gemmatimonadetes bacterium]|nr:hypothetical protein [Gemmatimonadota bacterium]